jgi:branched-chain amino acid transport system ATP-binding protein
VNRLARIDLSLVILAIVIAALAAGAWQMYRALPGAGEGLVIFAREQKDLFVDAGLIEESYRVHGSSPLRQRLREETVIVATRISPHMAYIGAGVILVKGHNYLKILTAKHVVAHQGRKVVIFPDHVERRVLTVVTSPTHDLAVVYVALDTFPVLGQRMTQRAGSLSGGEQQMLAMSRALLRRPRLLLLDEISFGLAPRVTRQLFDVVSDLARSGTTVVLVEQYLSDALRMADVVYVLARGEIAFAGEPSELAGQTLPGYVTAAK